MGRQVGSEYGCSLGGFQGEGSTLERSCFLGVSSLLGLNLTSRKIPY